MTTFRVIMRQIFLKTVCPFLISIAMYGSALKKQEKQPFKTVDQFKVEFDIELRDLIEKGIKPGVKLDCTAKERIKQYINREDFYYRIALREASLYYGSVAKVRELLSCGADINRKDYRGETALQIASRIDNVAVVRTLLSEGADINIRNNEGKTALHIASICDRVAAVRTLLSEGADINIKDNMGHTALEATFFYNPFWYSKKIKQELDFYAAVQKNPTLTNMLRKKAYQEHVKGNPVLLQLLLGFDSEMQDATDENDKMNPLSLTFQIEKNRMFFSNMLGDDVFGLPLLKAVEPMKRACIQERSKREIEKLRCKIEEEKLEIKEREMENMERLRIQEQAQCEFEQLKCEFEKIRRSAAPVVDQDLRVGEE